MRWVLFLLAAAFTLALGLAACAEEEHVEKASRTATVARTATPAATATRATPTPSPIVQAEWPTPTVCPAPTACPPAPTCPEPITCPTCAEAVVCPTCPEPITCSTCPTCPEPIQCATCPTCPGCFCPTCPEAITCPNGGDDFPGDSLCELLNELDQLPRYLDTMNAVDCGGAYECNQECDLDSTFEWDVQDVADFLRRSPPFYLNLWQLEHCIGPFYRP